MLKNKTYLPRTVLMMMQDYIKRKNMKILENSKKYHHDITSSELANPIYSLARAMALKACEGKDFKTTAEGRSALRSKYESAKAHIESAVDNYLDKV